MRRPAGRSRRVRRRKADRDGARAPGSEDRSADQQCRAGSNRRLPISRPRRRAGQHPGQCAGAGGTVACLGRQDGLARHRRHHQSGIQFRVPATSPYGDLRGSEGVRSPLQRSAKIRTQGTRRPGDGRLPRADGDEFLRGCINQDEGRRVRQRRAGGPPHLAVVRSEKVRRLSWTVQRARRHLASSSAAPQRRG